MIRLLLSIIAFAVAIGVLLLPGRLMEPVVITCTDSLDGWFPMLNLNHNAYYMWRLDHLSRAVAALFSPTYSVAAPLFRLIIIFIGTWLLHRCLARPGTQNSPVRWLLALIPVLLLLGVVGINPLVIGALAWVPLVAVACAILLLKQQPRWWWIAAVFVVVENCMSANAAAPLSAALALFLTSQLVAQDGEAPVSYRRRLLVYGLVLIPALYTAVSAPMPPAPDYPKNAHVVPDEGPEGFTLPLIGPTLGFESIHRADVRDLYGSIAVYSLILGVGSLILIRKSASKTVRSLVTFAVTLSVAAYLDTNLREDFAAIAPIASISRLLPWGTQYCLTAICIGVAAWALGLAWIAQPRKRVAVALGAVALLSISQTSPTIYVPFMHAYTTASDPDLRRYLCSPSAAVIRHFAYNHPNLMRDLSQMKALTREPFVDTSTLHGTVTMLPTPAPDVLRRSLAIEPFARWSARRGRQLGDELLTVELPQPVAVRGIELDPGNYATDFPRGLLISGGACDRSTARLLYETQSWQGSLSFTPRGYPYLSARNQVKVFFNQPETVSCLFVQQTGNAPFDWSVSRVRLVLAK